jgi:hypothetical protein
MPADFNLHLRSFRILCVILKYLMLDERKSTELTRHMVEKFRCFDGVKGMTNSLLTACYIYTQVFCDVETLAAGPEMISKYQDKVCTLRK